MPKITNDDLTWSGTGCFIAYPYRPYGNATVGIKGLSTTAVTFWQIKCYVWSRLSFIGPSITLLSIIHASSTCWIWKK